MNAATEQETAEQNNADITLAESFCPNSPLINESVEQRESSAKAVIDHSRLKNTVAEMIERGQVGIGLNLEGQLLSGDFQLSKLGSLRFASLKNAVIDLRDPAVLISFKKMDLRDVDFTGLKFRVQKEDQTYEELDAEALSNCVEILDRESRNPETGAKELKRVLRKIFGGAILKYGESSSLSKSEGIGKLLYELSNTAEKPPAYIQDLETLKNQNSRTKEASEGRLEVESREEPGGEPVEVTINRINEDPLTITTTRKEGKVSLVVEKTDIGQTEVTDYLGSRYDNEYIADVQIDNAKMELLLADDLDAAYAVTQDILSFCKEEKEPVPAPEPALVPEPESIPEPEPALISEPEPSDNSELRVVTEEEDLKIEEASEPPETTVAENPSEVVVAKEIAEPVSSPSNRLDAAEVIASLSLAKGQVIRITDQSVQIEDKKNLNLFRSVEYAGYENELEKKLTNLLGRFRRNKVLQIQDGDVHDLIDRYFTIGNFERGLHLKNGSYIHIRGEKAVALFDRVTGVNAQSSGTIRNTAATESEQPDSATETAEERNVDAVPELFGPRVPQWMINNPEIRITGDNILIFEEQGEKPEHSTVLEYRGLIKRSLGSLADTERCLAESENGPVKAITFDKPIPNPRADESGEKPFIHGQIILLANAEGSPSMHFSGSVAIQLFEDLMRELHITYPR